MEVLKLSHSTPQKCSPIILGQGLTKRYGNFFALKGVDITLAEGEFLALFGPNGAGKTTLLKILSTLMKPSSGSLEVCGLDPRVAGERLRKSIGFISHSTMLYDALSAYDNIVFFAEMFDLDRVEERAKKALSDMGLFSRMRDPVRTFSRGMKQRLAIARAIIHDPPILLLDEPYTGLDHQASINFTASLEKFHSEGKTMMMAIHDIWRGLEICQRAAIISAGRLVFEEKIYHNEIDKFEQIYLQHVGGGGAK